MFSSHQSRPIPGREEEMALNSAGGFVFTVDAKQQLYRWLIMGATGTYYATAEKLKFENAMNIKAFLDVGAGEVVVAAVVEVSEEGRAAKQEPGLLALAMCAALGDLATKRAALDAIPRVCRTATTLFTFLSLLKEMGKVAQAEAGAHDPQPHISWGRALRRAVGNWYLTKSPEAVAYQVTKYRNRAGWSHADVLACAHPAVPGPSQRALKRVRLEGGAATVAAKAAVAVPDQAVEVAAVTAAEALAACSLGGAAAGNGSGSGSRKRAAPEAAAGSGAGGEPAQAGAGEAAMAEAVAAAVAEAAAEAAQGQSQGQGQGQQLDLAVLEKAEAMRLVLAYASKGAVPNEAQAAMGPGQEERKRSLVARVARYLRAANKLRTLQAMAPAEPPTEDAPRRVRKPWRGGGAGAGKGGSGKRHAGRGRKAAHAAALTRVARRRYKGEFVPVMEWEARLREDWGNAAECDPEVVAKVVKLVKCYKFGWEHVGDQRLLRCSALWAAFLEGGMPVTAMVRNLGRMSSAGVFQEPACVAAVTKALRDQAAIAAARVHPLGLLEALRVYARGHGEKGGLSWRPNKEVEAALEAAFYLAFKTVQPTGKRILLGIDVSGSMDGCKVCGMGCLNAREASTAIAMALLRAEPAGNVECMAFARGFTKLDLGADQKLEDAMRYTREVGHRMDGTDCAKPMLYALQNKIDVDCFVVLTDNETYAGSVAPAQALQRYRVGMKRPEAGLIVLATSVTSFTIADPRDPRMLDIAGLDSAVPRLVAEFVTGQL